MPTVGGALLQVLRIAVVGIIRKRGLESDLGAPKLFNMTDALGFKLLIWSHQSLTVWEIAAFRFYALVDCIVLISFVSLFVYWVFLR